MDAVLTETSGHPTEALTQQCPSGMSQERNGCRPPSAPSHPGALAIPREGYRLIRLSSPQLGQLLGRPPASVLKMKWVGVSWELGSVCRFPPIVAFHKSLLFPELFPFLHARGVLLKSVTLVEGSSTVGGRALPPCWPHAWGRRWFGTASALILI